LYFACGEPWVIVSLGRLGRDPWANPMLRLRRFRNDDPPKLAAVWNDAFTGRGSYPLRSLAPLERCIFSKPYFDPAGFLVAEWDREVVGFAHAGFGPNADETAIDPTRGVLCTIAVRSSHRGRGIGSELLRNAELYLATHGTRTIHAGPVWPLSPFDFGLYGGSDLPGFLLSDAAAGPFLEAHGYQGAQTTLVLQRRLEQPVTIADPRFVALRRRYEVKLMPRASLGTWWQEAVLGLIEPVEFRLEDKLSNLPVARTLVWEMEGYSWRWNHPAVGLLEIQVRTDLRRQGLAKFLLTQMLRGLQEQYFGIVEVQTPERNPTALALFKSLGFEQVDVGRVYRRDVT
jgi:ribosomal protein S18 acetylase RimI-like enzyme